MNQKKKTSKKNTGIEKKLEKFYSAVEQTADGIFFTDIHGTIEYVNPAFEEITGFTKKEALGKNPRIIKSGLQSIEHYRKLWSTILAGKNFRSVVINRKKNGELFYADHTITPIKNEKGKVMYFVGIWKDITKQMLLEKRKDEFISTAGHELKNPVAGMKLYTQILQKHFDEKRDKKAAYFLSNLNFQINKLISLINNLLDLDKIKEGKLVLNEELFDFDELVKRIVVDYQYTAKKHQISRKGVFGEKIVGDKYRISQVLINLISNAIKYSPDGGEIVVSVSQKNKSILVSVSDYGMGIQKKEQKKIFEPFYRAGNQTDKISGIGLGLHIAEDIIKKHGGEIWVKSNRKKGSTFYFTIPARKK